MPLTAADLSQIDSVVRRAIAEEGKRAVPAVVVPRLTVKQFACAVELHRETVRKKIRLRAIPPAMVYGERDIRISPKALELFGVSPLEARMRLTAHSLWPACAPLPA
jgi:hypothetical protein